MQEPRVLAVKNFIQKRLHHPGLEGVEDAHRHHGRHGNGQLAGVGTEHRAQMAQGGVMQLEWGLECEHACRLRGALAPGRRNGRNLCLLLCEQAVVVAGKVRGQLALLSCLYCQLLQPL